jgi:trimethylamine--corrinoid protein Co-methyltransferase
MPRCMGFSPGGLVLGDDLIGQAQRCVRGIDVTEDMREVCLEGPGHYLGHSQTLSVMQTEYVYPAVADRTSPKEWAEIGKPDLVQKAIERKNRILSQSTGPLFDPATDAAIRAAFKIYV